LDNISLFIPVFAISVFFGNIILSDYSFFTKVLLLPQLLFSVSLTNYLQLNYEKFRKNWNLSNLFFTISVIFSLFISSYTFLFFFSTNFLSNFIDKTIFPFSFKISFLLICYYSIRFLVNPASVILILSKNYSLLGKVQLVLLLCELVSLIPFVLLNLNFNHFLLLNSCLGIFGYLFYLKSIIGTLIHENV
jgi:hypothetical protein